MQWKTKTLTVDMFCNDITFIARLVTKILSLPGYPLNSLFFYPNILFFSLYTGMNIYKQNKDSIKWLVSCNEMDDVFTDYFHLDHINYCKERVIPDSILTIWPLCSFNLNCRKLFFFLMKILTIQYYFFCCCSTSYEQCDLW